jgi:hypothetical protein
LRHYQLRTDHVCDLQCSNVLPWHKVPSWRVNHVARGCVPPDKRLPLVASLSDKPPALARDAHLSQDY